MRHMLRSGSVIALVLSLVLTVFALDTEWAGTFTVTGGSSQRLSSMLSVAGYTGLYNVDSVTWCNPSTNAGNMVFGKQNITMSTGFILTPGQCYTPPSGTRPSDLSAIYFRVLTDQPAMVALRSR